MPGWHREKPGDSMWNNFCDEVSGVFRLSFLFIWWPNEWMEEGASSLLFRNLALEWWRQRFVWPGNLFCWIPKKWISMVGGRWGAARKAGKGISKFWGTNTEKKEGRRKQGSCNGVFFFRSLTLVLVSKCFSLEMKQVRTIETLLLFFCRGWLLCHASGTEAFSKPFCDTCGKCSDWKFIWISVAMYKYGSRVQNTQ